MSTTRQDAWSKDEDILLAEVVLRLIREGGTQLQAFEEVGKLLSRTSAACGFRWNSYVRKQYKSAIEFAKQQRKQLKNHSILLGEPEEPTLLVNDTNTAKVRQKDMDEVFDYLSDIYDKAVKWEQQNGSGTAEKEKTMILEQKLTSLISENKKLQNELNSIEEAYKALVDLMEKARKMVVYKEEEKKHSV